MLLRHNFNPISIDILNLDYEKQTIVRNRDFQSPITKISQTTPLVNTLLYTIIYMQPCKDTIRMFFHILLHILNVDEVSQTCSWRSICQESPISWDIYSQITEEFMHTKQCFYKSFPL